MKTKRTNIRLICKHKNNGENNNNEVLGSRSSDRKKRGEKEPRGRLHSQGRVFWFALRGGGAAARP